MQNDSKLQHALSLAAQGFYIFRLSENSKIPLGGVSWSEVSTTDADIIRSWWTDEALGWELNYNIGIDCGKSKLLVIDVDTKEGKHGAESFRQLDLHDAFVPTLRVQTASGGFHYYYHDDAIPHRNTASKLALDIDTRGVGGFVVAPGSTITKGDKTLAYTQLAGVDQIAPLSDSLRTLLAASSSSAVPTIAGASVSTDADIDIAAAIEFLKTAEPAVEGSAGDNHTYITICQLKEFGVSARTACELLEEYWNPNCSPPWSHSDLVVKVKSAYKSAQQATGSRSATEFEGVYTGEEIKVDTTLLTPLAPFKLSSVPKREWVFEGLALKKKVSIVVAPAGSGKSTLTLSLAISKATGKDILGMNPLSQGRVALWNNEDDMEEQQRRLGAIMQHFALPFDSLYDSDALGERSHARLFLNSGEQRAFRVAKRTPGGVLKPEDAQAMINSIRANNIEMVIIDPFAETHPAKENDNDEILEIARIYRSIAQLANCAIVLVHHTRKLDAASADGHSGNLDSMRGAGSLGGVARVVVTFNTMSKKQATLYGVDENTRNRYVVLEGAKANFSPTSDSFRCFERVSETINATEEDMDGEKVGVLRPVQFEARAASPREVEYQLLRSIAACVEAEAKTITAVADQLVEEFAFYHDRKPESMTKMVRRLFKDQKSYVLDELGELVIEQPEHSRAFYIRLIGITTELASML